MEMRFLGGADSVGSLGLVVEENGTNILLDYGMSPTSPPGYPLEAPLVDAAFLTHAHLDHSGMIPQLCGKYGTEVYAAPITQALSGLLFKDSLKISELEGYPKPFSKNDIRTTDECFRTLKAKRRVSVNDLDIRAFNAGHIPGAVMYEIVGEKTTLFTGDLNTNNTHLTWAAKPVECDTLVIEGTYAGREHPPREEQEKEFLERIDRIVDRGGLALVPAFALGRTQEVMLMLRNCGLEVWVDGMGKTVNSIFQKFPEDVRSSHYLWEMRKDFQMVRTRRGRELALNGDVIVTTSGMLDGGPVLGYLDAIKRDDKSAVLLTGYQVEGTNGRMLKESGAVNIRGREEKVSCEVLSFDFSAHAGHSELLEFIRATGASNLVLMHSTNREALASELEGEMNVFLPRAGEKFEIV